MARYLGKETTRVDGLAKVTGKAKYTAEFQIPNGSYGFIVLSTVAKGRITAIDTRQAEQAGGVIRVFTHLNAGRLGPATAAGAAPAWSWPLQSDRVFFNGRDARWNRGLGEGQATCRGRVMRAAMAQAEREEPQL